MSDKRLAAIAYLIADIPMSEWPQHWKLDARLGVLLNRARACYLAIWRSTSPV